MNYLLLAVFCIYPFNLISQADRNATKETKLLYKNLLKQKGNSILFGHQEGIAYGLNEDKSSWQYEENRSDIKSISGEHPAVVGFDLGKLELDSTRNINGIPFTVIRKLIIQHYQRGGVITLSWHPNNPTDSKLTSWDKCDSTIFKILNDKQTSFTFFSWLERLSKFIKTLKDPKSGKQIPVIFRPWHEHTGSWFWWGEKYCTGQEYIKLWIRTFQYFSKEKKMHNILYSYSPDFFFSKKHYLERYPGDNIIDILGYDVYQTNAPKSNDFFKNSIRQKLILLDEIGIERNKLIAITEIGQEGLKVNNWWTNILSPMIKDIKFSYILAWRNADSKHFFVPFKGQSSASDFIEFLKISNIILEQKTKKLYLYK